MYKSTLNLLDTEIAIKFIKDTFERDLAKALKLTRVSAPLFVQPETGLNDNLNGFERAVRFDVLTLKKEVEIVQSLAKWKRMALAKYGFEPETGLYTDMNAIRRDEDLDAIHSVYVDQWDWEKIITKNDRKLSYLKKTVKSIYKALKKLSVAVNKKYPALTHDLPDEITFISTKELEQLYPELSRKERENAITKKHRAVFIYQIGWNLSDGAPHDGRAADYDDWKLNGDLLLWYDVLGIALEISSMGIRVDEKSLVRQLKKKGELDKLHNPYCQGILNGELPLTIGGGIGQSRLCMFFLNKAHIGEVQASVWSEENIEENAKKGIHLL
ncbi:MAG: aspartate--ammonia ligase [Clostridiales bacterium]|nr:aspartate--ammonia ligase [Clostridiales bacterium]